MAGKGESVFRTEDRTYTCADCNLDREEATRLMEEDAFKIKPGQNCSCADLRKTSHGSMCHYWSPAYRLRDVPCTAGGHKHRYAVTVRIVRWQPGTHDVLHEYTIPAPDACTCQSKLALPEAQPTPPTYDYPLFVSDWLGKHGQHFGYLADMLKDFHNLVAAQPTPGWTFVDATKHPHGMPPQYDEVLFSTTYEQVEKGKWNGSESERNRRWQSCEVDSQNDPIFFCDDEVIAWQLLPSPPEPTPTKKENA